MGRVIHFELPADNPERAVKFYETVFGWKITKWEGPVNYWLVETGEEGEPGINGAIADRSEALRVTANTIGVDSLDDAVQKVEENGGNLFGEKLYIPNVGHFAYAQDTEGNVFGMMEPDPTTMG